LRQRVVASASALRLEDRSDLPIPGFDWRGDDNGAGWIGDRSCYGSAVSLAKHHRGECNNGDYNES